MCKQAYQTAHRLHTAGVEGFDHQTSKPGVVGWILEQQGAAHAGVGGIFEVLFELNFGQARVVAVAQLFVSKGCLYQLVTG